MREEEDDPKDIAAANALIDSLNDKAPLIAVELDENNPAYTRQLLEVACKAADSVRKPVRVGVIGHTSPSKSELAFILAGLDLNRRVEVIDRNDASLSKGVIVGERVPIEPPKVDLVDLAKRMEYREQISMPIYCDNYGDTRSRKADRKAARPRWRR